MCAPPSKIDSASGQAGVSKCDGQCCPSDTDCMEKVDIREKCNDRHDCGDLTAEDFNIKSCQNLSSDYMKITYGCIEGNHVIEISHEF